MNKLEMTLNKEKTRIVNLWDGKDGFNFLGYHRRKEKRRYIDGTVYYKFQRWLSDKAKDKIKQKIRECL